jgi:hypothetical protein
MGSFFNTIFVGPWSVTVNKPFTLWLQLNKMVHCIEQKLLSIISWFAQRVQLADHFMWMLLPGKTQPKYLDRCKVFYGWLHKALLHSCTVLL